MILVPNHQRPSNGSSGSVMAPKPMGSQLWFKAFLGVLLLFSVASCIPRGAVVEPSTGPTPRVEEEKTEEPLVEESKAPIVHEVALLLPFQLNRSGASPSSSDIQRATLALDFYQGFRLGLERRTAEGAHFKLNVLDSRDSEDEVRLLARTEGVEQAALVVGPIYPKEIQVFASAAGLKERKVLQISPLAATMPTEFNLPNLVSMTSPIMTHVRALARQIVDHYKPGDAVFLFETDESSSEQFLSPLRSVILELNRNVAVYEVNTAERLEELIRFPGKNLIVSGSTNRFQVVSLLAHLRKFRDETGHQFQLFGHPNWAKMSFTDQDGLDDFQTLISSTYFIDQRKTEVRDFQTWYRDEYEVEPSEFSYKGYDAGMYFGQLLARYGANYQEQLVNTPYEGLHNAFEFQYHSQWGFVNQSVHFLRFVNGRFVRQ